MQNYSAILLDVEGTVAPISFVHEVLFPYARREMQSYLRDHWNDLPIVEARRLLQPMTQQTVESVTNLFHSLMDRDVKDTALKQVQGLIWERGYQSGAFRSPIYDDVPHALRRWNDAGKAVAIYSSGSIAAQKVFFRHTTAGDLTPLLSTHFDTTIGAKKSSASYAAIATAIRLEPGQILFITDIGEEANAAQAAGMPAVIAVRPGNAPVTIKTFETVTVFDAI